MRTSHPVAAVLAVTMAVAAMGAAQPRRAPADEPLLNVGPRPATAAIVTFVGPAPALDPHESDMTRRLRGVALELSAQDLAKLRATIPGNAPRTASTEHAVGLFTMTLTAPGITGPKVVHLLRAPDGTIIGAEDEADGSPGSGRPSIPLDSGRITEFIRAWPTFRGDFTTVPEPAKTGVVFELPGPYHPGAFTLDTQTVRERLFGRGSKVEPSRRVLDSEMIYVRLPAGYSPRRPAGLVVFIDPTLRGHPPPPLHMAADELGFILVGAAGSGNERAGVERIQLALDAAATVAARYHVDPLRTYAAGMSGGGRISSMLWAGFPEVFRGAVAMVGVNTYQNLPAGGGRAWRAGFAKPTGARLARLKSQRLAAITGSRDANQAQTLAAIGFMKADGLAVKEYDYPDLAHEYPSPERFAEALLWVDEPGRELRAKESADAAELLAQFKRADASGRMDPAARRRALVEITRVGPWTDAAWEAAALLGLAPDSGRATEE